MSRLKTPFPVKLITSLLYKDRKVHDLAVQLLEQKWGKYDFRSEEMAFPYTSYYQEEMGSPLCRSLLSFQSLIDRDKLAEMKLYSNEVEQHLSTEKGRRTVNIDPGCLSGSQFILATGKDFSHRVYLGKGIFADITLIFKHNGFHSLPWTYPDYKDQPIQLFLLEARKRYLEERVRA